MAKFPEDAQVVERSRETDAEIVRRQPSRAMLRRTRRNRRLKFVPAEPALTPFATIRLWAAALSSKPTISDLDNLAGKLRGARLLQEEDGGLAGQRIVDGLTEQANLIQAWPQRARLKTLAGQLHGLLSELGLL